MPIQGVPPRLLEIGRIRMGEKGKKGEPRKLDHWRLTSSHIDSLNAASKLYGGVVGEWEGGYELRTETDVLDVLVPPNAFTSYLEAWTAGGIQRRCDGLTELITGDECICSVEGNQVCEPSTNLRVLLPQLPGIGSWRLATKGWTAAAELQGTIELLQRTAHAGEWPAAELFLDHRSKVVAGQTRNFSVPVLRLPYSLAELGASETRSLGSGAIVRVDTITGEINPEPPSRETPPGETSVHAVSTPGGTTSPATPTAGTASSQGGTGKRQPRRRSAGDTSAAPREPAADDGGGVDTTSSVPTSSSAGPKGVTGEGRPGPVGGSSPGGEPAPHRSSQSGRGQTGAEPPGASPYPLDPKDCLHTVGVDIDGKCVDCGMQMEVSA